MVQSFLANFASESGEKLEITLSLPINVTPAQLQLVVNQLLPGEEPIPYAFAVNDIELKSDFQSDILSNDKYSEDTELTFTIVYKPQALFRVRPVSRCSSTLAGHKDAILCVSISPDGRRAISGSGDSTVRLWDIATETPIRVCDAHKNWVLCVSWSPNGQYFATGSMDNQIFIWNGGDGSLVGRLSGHSKWITSLSWEPFHLNPECDRIASSSKDGTVRVWNVKTLRCEYSVSQHKDAISCVRWSGEGLLYTAGRDKTIKVWDAKDGKLCRILLGHAHWINTMALSTDYALKCGPFDRDGHRSENTTEATEFARSQYDKAKGSRGELMVTGSDDFTLFLWKPSESKKSIARLTGHQQLVNHVQFSPDGRMFASASFDKSIKLWDSSTGKFMSSLRGHVSPVYQIAFSADSRLLLSGSKDSTLKVWDVKSGKVKADLPGHADEVYTVDWSSVKGGIAMSGGKDRLIKFWRQ